MTGDLLALLVFATSLQTEAGGRPRLDDTTRPQGQVRRLGDSEVATYVVNHGIWPAGIVGSGNIGEVFLPDGTHSRGSVRSRLGTYKVDQGQLCVIYGEEERCRLLYVNQAGVVFAAPLGADETEGELFPLDPDWREPGR